MTGEVLSAEIELGVTFFSLRHLVRSFKDHSRTVENFRSEYKRVHRYNIADESISLAESYPDAIRTET